MKFFLLPVFLLSALLFGSCVVPAEQNSTPSSTANTPPPRKGTAYDEPPVEPATKGPAAEPAKKKGHTK